MNHQQSFALFSVLRLISLMLVVVWALLVFIGIWWAPVGAFAGKVVLPAILASVLGNEVFKRLGRGAERRAR